MKVFDKRPVVSVLMSVHNGEKYLPETLDTLLAQTMRDFELVVIDDGSQDSTHEILQAYAERDARIKPVRNERNMKLPASLNRGLKLCRAPLVARADADDLYLPEYLETQVAHLQANPSVGVISSAFHVADADGTVLYTRYLPTEDQQIRFELLFMSRLLHPTTVFRTDLVRGAGGYSEEHHGTEDYELWARLRDFTQFANHPEPLVRYRRHSETISETKGNAGQRLSLSVSQGLLSQYLGFVVTLEDADVLRAYFYGMAILNPRSVSRGSDLLKQILRQAAERESPETVERFRRRTARHLMSYSFALVESDRSASRNLFWCALRMNPGGALPRKKTVRFLGRLYAPEGVVRYARKLLHERELDHDQAKNAMSAERSPAQAVTREETWSA